MYIFFWGPREGGACDDKRQGLPVSPPDIKLWIYWLWLGKLRGSCPLREWRAVNENGVICSEARKTSSFKRSSRNLGKQSFKAGSCYGNLAFQTNDVIKIPPVPSVVPTLNHTFQIAWPPLEGVFSNAGYRECVNRYDGFTRWHQTRLPCGNNKWNHWRMAMGVTHSQNIKQMEASSSFVWKPFSSIERGCSMMTQSLIKKKKSS